MHFCFCKNVLTIRATVEAAPVRLGVRASWDKGDQGWQVTAIAVKS